MAKFKVGATYIHKNFTNAMFDHYRFIKLLDNKLFMVRSIDGLTPTWPYTWQMGKVYFEENYQQIELSKLEKLVFRLA
jgi:hypothetical protein